MSKIQAFHRVLLSALLYRHIDDAKRWLYVWDELRCLTIYQGWYNKRTRCLHTLVGHLLVKRMPVLYNLSSTKIPEYLSENWIQGRQKLEMHRMTPNLPWTLNGDKYSASTKEIPPKLKFLSILLYNYWFSRYKVARKSEMHSMTPNWTWTLNYQK